MQRDEAARVIDEAAREFSRRSGGETVTADAKRFLIDRLTPEVLAAITPDKEAQLSAAALDAFQTASAAEARNRYDDAKRRAGFSRTTQFLDTPPEVARELAVQPPISIGSGSIERIFARLPWPWGTE
jgi:hypothetical protein